MSLKDIGFYTLEDARCEGLTYTSPMWRCEMILTEKCNFKCTYCRGLRPDCKEDMPLETAMYVLDQWCAQGLKNIRFSGGEPLLYPHLETLVKHAKDRGVERIAVSSNGSLPFVRYNRLCEAGVNDFSISLDACCASECDRMSGSTDIRNFLRIQQNIIELSKMTYVTVGIVLTNDNIANLKKVVEYAHELGVGDIRIIPAAQEDKMIEGVETLDPEIVAAHPILAYRVKNILEGRHVRSIQEYDTNVCYIPIDDSVVCGDYHFPCVIYMREQGEPIGRIGPDMRAERVAWSLEHNSFKDPICRANCLDVCIDHNNKCTACVRNYDGER